MPKDYLFPPLLGVSRLITLTADTAFNSNMLGAVVSLNGHTLTLSGSPEGYGFLVVTGAGDLAGAVTLELGSTQAVFVALEGGEFHFVEQADVNVAALEAAIALKAPLASPALTGTPTAPTAAPGTNSTQLATCAFVILGLSGKSDVGHTHSIGNITGLQAALDALAAADDLKAPLANPAFTGTPTAPTAAPGTNTNQLATTAFVVAAISGLGGGGGGTWGSITGTLTSQADLAAALTDAKARANHTGTQSMATITGLDAAITDAKARANHTGEQAISTVTGLQTALDAKAPLASPAFTGTPTVPTAPVGTNSAQAASTAFVQAACAAVEGGGMPVLVRTAAQGAPSGVFSGDWTARDSVRNWRSIACSENGVKAVAGLEDGNIYTTTDTGVTWISRGVIGYFRSLASSADGDRLAGCVLNGSIHTSSDGGITWIERASVKSWRSIASSSDGLKLVAAEYTGPTGGLWISDDAGANWTQVGAAKRWQAVACSADGQEIIASASGDYVVWRSVDRGATWQSSSGITNAALCLAMSSNGGFMVAGTNQGVYTSIDHGSTWDLSYDGVWVYSIAISSDGSKVLFGSADVHVSVDYGQTWVTSLDTATYPPYVACAGDGSRFLAAFYNNNLFTVEYNSVQPAGPGQIMIVGDDGAGSLTGNGNRLIYISPDGLGWDLFASIPAGVFKKSDGSLWLLTLDSNNALLPAPFTLTA